MVVERFEEGEVQLRTTLYELIVHAECGDEAFAVPFLRYVDETARDLATLVPSDLMPAARQQVRGLFEDFADDDSHLREKLGELFANLYVLRTADVTAAGFEVPAVPGGSKTFDLAVRASTGATFPIEILNVFLDDERMTDPQGLHAFLDGRVQRKVREKLGLTLPATDLPFPLLLVVWFKRVETMARFADAVVSRNRQFELPPCALMQLADPAGCKCWDFGSISSLVRRYPT